MDKIVHRHNPQSRMSQATRKILGLQGTKQHVPTQV
jgi:hypothetical protein